MSLIKVFPNNIPDTHAKFGVDCMKLIFFLKKNIPSPMVGKMKLTENLKYALCLHQL